MNKNMRKIFTVLTAITLLGIAYLLYDAQAHKVIIQEIEEVILDPFE